MAAIEANTTLQANTKTTIEMVRPLADFPPSIWGDCFLSFSLDNSELEAYAKTIEEHKEEMRSFITNPTIDSNAKLSFIYSVYRLGLTYLFMKEIDDQLDTLFTEINMQDYVEVDLHTISIHFQVFRNHGYRFSCDVFNKFKDCSSGTFKEDIISDVRGMLSFYESAQLRIKGETILDEAFIFTESNLKSIENTLEGNLARQVKYALFRPFHRGMQIVEARMYLLNYEEECSTYGSLLKLAKLHFNYLQLLQKEELRIVSQWWKDMDILTMAPYLRDRITELYLWVLALFMEPYYSQVRIITTKLVAFVLLLDDTYDAYATIDEIRLLTHAINRWEVSAIEQLPEYFKPIYEIFLNEFTELYQQQAKEGREYLVDATKEAFQKLARAYLQEAEWRHNKEVPLFEEYMKIGLITSTHEFLSKSCLIGMGKIVTKEGFAWYQTYPKILKDSELIGRLQDDVSSFEFERERDATATGVDAYMKTFEVSEKIAVEEVKKIIENTWKDIYEGCLKPRDVPMDLLAPIVNLARIVDVAYKYHDGFTFPEKIFKECITLLFQVSVPI
uniref:Sesquiterpene synthase 3 n=1 Tax=Senecio scandens var. incisus TaxID=366643 RepID=A0A6G7SEP6_9ASTR|nr:sesquiterpene synthase 3 [Senecio scandens var. incisus]